jgi:hypothetical protein
MLLLVLCFLGGSVLEVSATSYYLAPYYDWTIRAGNREFGFEGFTPSSGLGGAAPSVFNTTTVIHYGCGATKIRKPVIVVATLFVTLPLLASVGCFFFVRHYLKYNSKT